jgi:hypothetical protein
MVEALCYKQKVASSISVGVLKFFIDLIFLAAGSTQHLTEISTRDISSGVRAVGAYG